MKNLFAFLFGGLFQSACSQVCLILKKFYFLDLLGDWDASLAFVMMGAILVAFIPFQKAKHNPNPTTLFNEPIDLPKNQKIDPKLLSGSLLFGMGWGIAGICPAPSFTLIGLGHYQALYFIAAMLLGV